MRVTIHAIDEDIAVSSTTSCALIPTAAISALLRAIPACNSVAQHNASTTLPTRRERRRQSS